MGLVPEFHQGTPLPLWAYCELMMTMEPGIGKKEGRTGRDDCLISGSLGIDPRVEEGINPQVFSHEAITSLNFKRAMKTLHERPPRHIPSSHPDHR